MDRFGTCLVFTLALLALVSLPGVFSPALVGAEPSARTLVDRADPPKEEEAPAPGRIQRRLPARLAFTVAGVAAVVLALFVALHA